MPERKLRTCFLVAATVLAMIPIPTGAQVSSQESHALARQLMSERRAERREAAQKILKTRDPALIPALVDALFYTPKLSRAELLEVLRGLAGEDAGEDYYSWVELVGRRTELTGGTGYMEWKLSLLARIDPSYQRIFYPGAPARIRLEEIVWGGVKLDGIPSLEDPPRVAASEARFLTGRELVFGVSAGGAHHAYPLRFLSWHEMVNDRIGGEPITLSY